MDRGSPGAVSASDLERLYAYPSDSAESWVQANFVASIDRVSGVNGDSECLSGEVDWKMLGLGRIVDETGFLNKGTKSAGVGRQYSGGGGADREFADRRVPGLCVVAGTGVDRS